MGAGEEEMLEEGGSDCRCPASPGGAGGKVSYHNKPTRGLTTAFPPGVPLAGIILRAPLGVMPPPHVILQEMQRSVKIWRILY